MDNPPVSRRQMLASSFALGAAVLLSPALLRARDNAPTTAATSTQRYKISACDWIMLKRQTNGAITRAAEYGCDGVETDMGPLGDRPTFENKFLSQPGFADKYLADCQTNKIEISSIAMSGYYAQSFPERPYEQPIKDCIATCKLLGVKTAFLPLGVSDVAERPWLYTETVERLKRVGDWAGEAGITIGIETMLKAESQCKMLADINNPAIKIYYNFQDGVRNGRDLIKELKALGNRIVQIHPTNNDVYWLQDDPAIKMPEVKKTLDEIGYEGWLVIERSRRADLGRDVKANFTANASYLKKIFQC